MWLLDGRSRRRKREAGPPSDRKLTASERLALFPESGRILPEFPDLSYREVIVGNYRVVYRQDGATVWILAVVHGATAHRSCAW